MQDIFIAAFVTFFVVIDPPGILPIFASLTEGASGAHRRRMAIKSTVIALLVLVGFAYGGDWLLGTLHVSLDAFRIAGGALLFLLALDMLFEKRTERREERAEHLLDSEGGHPPADISVFPMAIPMISGPGAIASMLLFMSEAETFTTQLVILAAATANIAICLGLFLMAGLFMRVIGDTIAAMITRILSIILAALAAQFILDGIRGAFSLASP